jgi:acetyl esterase
LYTLSVEEARAADLAAVRASGGAAEPVARVVDHWIPGPGGAISIRCYHPGGSDPGPVLVYFFGGGWTLGTIETSDGVCRALANASGCVTIAVGYRLAPEHKFPAAVEDCYAAIRWISGHGGELGADVTRLAVAGDSSGGNLAAVTSLLARDRGGPRLTCQVLIYPNTNHDPNPPTVPGDIAVPFDERSVRWYWGHYLADPADGASPLASPLRAPDLGGLPSTLVITAEYDPLRAEGELYAHRLADAGVDVELTRYAGMIHGFFTMLGELDASRDAVAQAAAFLRVRLTAPRRR